MPAPYFHPEPRGRGYRVFFSQFRDNFLHTGAVAPSSAALARAITRPLAAAGPGPLRVLEVGAGTGVVTAAILDQLHPGDRFDIYEINPVFGSWIEACFRRARAPERGIDCQLHLAEIATLGPGQFDFIISGLPLNNFPAAEVERILEMLLSRLRPGGTLSYFEYAFVRRLKRALVQDPRERARLEAVGAVVERVLGRHRCGQTPVLWNLPPAIAHHLRCQ